MEANRPDYAREVLSYMDEEEACLFSGENVDFRNPHLACISRAFATAVIFHETKSQGSLSEESFEQCVSMGLLEAEVQACIDSGLVLPFPSARGETPDFPYPYDVRHYEQTFEMWRPREEKGTACIIGGKFDLLTVAHINYIRMLRELFDTVIVVLASDREVWASSVDRRPIWPFPYRVANLRRLGVDKIIEGGDVLDLIDLKLPFPLFCLHGHISTRLEAGSFGVRLVMQDPGSLFLQGLPVISESIEHTFTEDEILHPQRTIAGNPNIARSVEITAQSLPYPGMSYCATDGDSRADYMRFIAAIHGMNFRLMPNRFPEVHSSDVIEKFGIRGLDDVRRLL